MKRFLIMFMVLGLITGTVATAEAKKKKPPTRVERTVWGSYECNPFGVWPPICDGSHSISVATDATEAFFTAEVSDAHGQPLYVEVHEDYPGNNRLVGSFCGETSEPISFHPGAELTFSIDIWLRVTPMSCPAGRFATNGTTSVTLSNLP